MLSGFEKKKIGVLMGGVSTERDISLRSGEAVLKALNALGYNATGLFVDRDLDLLLRESCIDVAFNALHGGLGEDGCVQGLLEMRGIPYTGSGVLASALAMNKVKAKALFRLHNLPTPAHYTVTQDSMADLEEHHGSFGFPAVVKPAAEGSSIGVAFVQNGSELVTACEDALRLGSEVLVERFIPGKEVHVGILDGNALGAIRIVPSRPIFDYQAKYGAGSATFQMPAKLSNERYRGVITQALRAHQVLGCTGATRVNMIVSELGNEYVLEVNTGPGLTKRSVLPKIARHAGLSFAALTEAILAGAHLSGKRAIRSDYVAPSATALPTLATDETHELPLG